MSEPTDATKKNPERKTSRLVSLITPSMAELIRAFGVQLSIQRKRAVPESEVVRVLLKYALTNGLAVLETEEKES